MPDIFSQFNQALAEKDKANVDAPAGSIEEMNQKQVEQLAEMEKMQTPVQLPNTLSSDPNVQKGKEERAYSDYKLGGLTSDRARELQGDPEAWSPEYTDQLFIEEAGQSFMRGVGKYVVKGLGDMVQVAGGLIDSDISDGTMLSRALQEAGEGWANQFMDYVPEELRHENLDWTSMMNPQFWSQNIAEMVPQLIEFIALSKGGGALARKGLGKLAKKAPGATKTALGKEVFGTGKGLAGKLATDQGLTRAGALGAEAFGGGLTSNVMAGMMNAAEVINNNKELGIYSEDELKQMAANVMKRNARWLAFDIASFGMTYGGGWKALKNLNPVAKGATSMTRGQQGKIASKLFQYDVAPAIKGLARVGKKAAFEGVEEQFQESYEEWVKLKAKEDVTGEETGYDGFMDFFLSEENKGTRVVSTALGALGGGAFNITSLVNKAADDNYLLLDRMANFKEIVDKQGTEKQLTAQEYFRRDTLANIVVEGREDLYEDFSNALVENGNINEEEKAAMDEQFQEFKKMKDKGERLNVRGLKALLGNKAKYDMFASQIEEIQEVAKQNIQEIQELEVSEEEKQARIKKEESNTAKKIRVASIGQAAANANIQNLLIGKLAKPIEMEVALDEFGNEMLVGGLSTRQYDDWVLGKDQTLQDDIDLTTGKTKKRKIGDLVSGVNTKRKEAENVVIPTLSKMGKKAREIYDSATAKIFGDPTKETEEEKTPEEQAETSSDVEGATTTLEDGTQVQLPVNEAEAEAQATRLANTVPTDQYAEPIGEEELYNTYQETGEVPAEVLDEIARRIAAQEPLSAQDDQLRKAFANDIQMRVVQNLLGTETDQRPVVDRKVVLENERKAEEEAEAKRIKEAEEEMGNIDDSDLSTEEKEFVQSVAESKIGKKVKTAAQWVEDQAKKAKKKFLKKDTDVSDDTVMDKRSADKAARKVAPMNVAQLQFEKNLRDQLANYSKNREAVSQNEVDNYLNSYSTYNEFGPSEIDNMVVVNHQLKRMFPNTNSPTQMFIVRNLFESIGSMGLASVLGSTIYIDAKAPEQNKMFMHEMSHIWYRVSKDEPFTKNLRDKVIRSKKLMERIKQLYPDYEQFLTENGVVTLADLKNNYAQVTGSTVDFEENLQDWKKSGQLRPLVDEQQELWIEEAFVATLEGPLDKRFDKVFSARNDYKRARDTRMWWGLLRKKGEIIYEDGSVDRMLRKMMDDVPQGEATLEDYMKKVFATVTQGVTIDSYQMDARAKQKDGYIQERLEEIGAEVVEQNRTYTPDTDTAPAVLDDIEEQEIDQEERGDAFYNNDFQSRIRKARKILRRFGAVYNKGVRVRNLKETEGQEVDRGSLGKELLNRNFFETLLFNLAEEKNDSRDFIRSVEDSRIEEMRQFNKFLDKVHPNSKKAILDSMHFVFSNGKHVVGMRNTLDNNKKYGMENSMSQTEKSMVDETLAQLRESLTARDASYLEFENAVDRIRQGNAEQEHYYTVFKALAGDMYRDNLQYRNQNVLAQGTLTYRGINVPIEQLLYSTIKSMKLLDHKKGGPGIYIYGARPIVESILVTGRKFSPRSTVLNAEGQGEPLRIVNNHLTKEFDAMIDHLRKSSLDEIANLPEDKLYRRAKKSGIARPEKYMDNYALAKDISRNEFVEAFSHVGAGLKESLGKAYTPNNNLVFIHDRYIQTGILPQITQYHGLENYHDKQGSLFKNSTALEQGLEDFMTFVNTSHHPNGRRAKYYLGNMGAFADSPRKFYTDQERVDIERFLVVDRENKKADTWNPDGVMLNNMFRFHQAMFDDEIKNKDQFKKKLFESMKWTIQNINANAEQLQGIKLRDGISLDRYFDKVGDKKYRLNFDGQLLAMEYTLNNILNGYNIADTFLPGVKLKDFAKRFKMNTSPVMDAKNPNFKWEPVFFSDEISNNNSIAGTDSAMYLLEEDAELFFNMGKGVFELGAGLKLLNASVEKNNPNFKGKTAYLKGYTTVVGEEHPLYAVLKARKEKYKAWHMEKYGKEPSRQLNDGTPNHMVIAIPESSDKSSFIGQQFISEDENGQLNYTEQGAQRTPEALMKNFDVITEENDKLFYDKKGNYVGLDSYNFGVQQIMDKKTDKANTPVQMINAIITNATINGQMDLAVEIQQLISDAKQENLMKLLDVIKEQKPEEYRELVWSAMNKEDMDQSQRLLLEENGSLANPYVNEIVVNQLAKSIRRVGNKLVTEGTYAHQKSDIGGRLLEDGATISPNLKGYRAKADGSGNMPAEIIVPPSVPNVEERREYTLEQYPQLLSQAKNKYGNEKRNADIIDSAYKALRQVAKKRAERRAKKNGGTWKDYLTEKIDSSGKLVGYTVAGDRVIASRVPGHGPGSTGVFEVIGFTKGKGNQVMVGPDFNDIIGADNDGDALFIQTGKGGGKFWNKAFQKMTQYWLSPEMSNQIQTQMEFEEETTKTVNEVAKDYPQAKSYTVPFSPEQKYVDYNNTMVAKRNVGPVFNIHKVANMLAAYETPLSSEVVINGVGHQQFLDREDGQNSRNQRSATLANIILDNAKYGFAKALGLDEYNIPHAAILVNLGVSLEDVGKILNSKAAKMWSTAQRENASLYHGYNQEQKVLDDIKKRLGLSSQEKYEMNIDTKLLKDENNKNQQGAVIELLRYLSQVNNEIASISGLMSGHNKIHVNPLVLEKQLGDFRDQIKEKTNEERLLQLSDAFISNPDLQNYLMVAEETLKHLKTLNPVYRNSTNEVLSNLFSKVGKEISIKQLEEFSKDLMLFNSSRLLALNNLDPEYVRQIMDPTHENSVFSQVKSYMKKLSEQRKKDKKDILKSVDAKKNSLLFTKALNMRLENTSTGTTYISANSDFKNDSFNRYELDRVRDEFKELPPKLQEALMVYDLIEHNWKGYKSMLPYFSKATTFALNATANRDAMSKNDELSPAIKRQLENAIALKSSISQRNPFLKVYLKGKKEDPSDRNTAIKRIFASSNPYILEQIKKGQPLYINVRNGNRTALYEIPALTDEQYADVEANRTRTQKQNDIVKYAKENIQLVEGTIPVVKDRPMPNITIATIADKSLGDPYEPGTYGPTRESLANMKKATVSWQEMQEQLKKKSSSDQVMDARESFDEETFSRLDPLSRAEYDQAMEYEPYISETVKKDSYEKYLRAKAEANDASQAVLEEVSKADTDKLLSMYEEYGQKPVYAYSIILTPIIKKLANNLASDQAALFRKNKVEGKPEGDDVSAFRAYMMTGSTIPSNHPAAQGLTRMLEGEFKKFTQEKKQYMKRLNKVTDELYKEKLGIKGSKYSPRNIAKRIKQIFGYITGRSNPYEALYGNLVERKETVNDKGTLVYNYKLRPAAEVKEDHRRGLISDAELNFYTTFKEITSELMPERIQNIEEDYIPHTAMSRLEAFGSRGLLGLMVTSKPKSQQIYNVKMYHKNPAGEKVLMNFKQIEDQYKIIALNQGNKLEHIKEYRRLKRKAMKLLESGTNENGSKIQYDPAEVETALGFGAINRFANNRSIKATELPSMDLNKALADYIHSTIFVDGSGEFKGMRKLQGYIDGVLAYNREKGYNNVNNHIQKVWKDYFLRGRRQTSFAGKTVDRVILGLTRMNLFYALGYSANVNTGGLYAMGNILAGKYHNIKDLGGKAWIRGEARYWGLDKGFKGGIEGVIKRHKRAQRMMKEMNFMEINVYDEVALEKKNGLDTVFGDLALMPMIASENYIQRTHMLGLMSEEEFDSFDENGNQIGIGVSPSRLIELEDRVKSSHGRGYQPTDQRAVQLYSWGTMMLQFSRYIPTMMNDRFAKEDVNIYGRKNIGTLTAVGKMLRRVANDPSGFIKYRNSLSDEERQKLDAGLRGLSMAAIISMVGVATQSETARELFWDSNYYWDHDRLLGKLVPAPIRTMDNLSSKLF